MATPEGEASKRVRLAASSLNMRLMRNNNGAFQDSTGRWIRYGWGNESKKLNKEMAFGDFIGETQVTITPQMVGKTVAVLTMLEVKPDGDLPKTLKKATTDPDSREAAQLRAIQYIRSRGGIAWFASNEIDVETIHRLFIQELEK